MLGAENLTTDGIDALVDPDRGLVSPEVYLDQGVYEMELDRIFGRCWLFLAHECQLKKPGDFLTTYMGADPVIVVRQKDGSVAAFLNACRHRGMRVCREDYGNAAAFTCPYHGWAYNAGGSLTSMPREDVYGGIIDKTQWGLRRVAQIDSYRGLIFATFDPAAPHLLEYLGDMAFYVDAAFGRVEAGAELIGGVQKWRVKGNWKLAAEQFASDMYHTYTAHLSPYIVMAKDPGGDPFAGTDELGLQFSDPRGHGAGWWAAAEDAGDDGILSDVVQGYIDDVRGDVAARLGSVRANMESHATVFPNFSFLSASVPAVRVFHPKGPNEMEVSSWAYVDADAPAEVKEELRKLVILTFGPGGLFEQDDGDNWAAIQQNIQSPQVRKSSFNLQLGLHAEPGSQPGLPGRIGPGIGEMAARGFHRAWRDLMTSPQAWPQPTPPNETHYIPNVATSTSDPTNRTENDGGDNGR